ncbi:hypothetical protein NMY22_g9664 [Coprinellus aureogranulatus]|nr:hypothetical protein NMY22_g9664 [Coprinellus aureogranulatus]
MAPGKRNRVALNEENPSAIKFRYPTALVQSAKAKIVTSPSKRTRKYTEPLKPRRPAKPTQKPVAEAAGSVAQSFIAHADTMDTLPFAGGDDGGQEQEREPGVEVRCDTETPSHAPSIVTTEITDSQLASYRYAIDTGVAGFTFIEDTTFVVEGWNVAHEQTTAGWYHFQYVWRSSALLNMGCTCPDGMRNLQCVHKHLFQHHEVPEKLKSVRPMPRGTFHASVLATARFTHSDAGHGAVLFLRQELSTSPPEFLTLFSVKGHSTTELLGRAIVSHSGFHPLTGSWRCSKDSGKAMCTHINSAKDLLRDLVGDCGSVEDLASIVPSDTLKLKSPGNENRSISHQYVYPPHSVSLPSDRDLGYCRPPPFRIAPSSTFPLDSLSSCPCTGSRRTFYVENSGPTTTEDCEIFTLSARIKAKVQLQRCPTCAAPGRFIGPDLGNVGLFNWNNKILASHELLDEYTILFAASETPFTSFVTLLSHRYSVSEQQFMGEDLFREIWFAYVTLQAFENDMACSQCGPHPATIVWDGVTLAFGKKHVSSTLSPPTTVSDTSLIRNGVKNHPKQQLLPDAGLRKQLRQIVKASKTPGKSAISDEDEDDESAVPSTAQGQLHPQKLSEQIQRIEAVRSKLSSETKCEALCTLFLEWFGGFALLQSKRVPREYKTLFLQIAAEESVLQMVNGTAIEDLRIFLANPHPACLGRIVSIPAVYQLGKMSPERIPALLPILRWLLERAEKVLQQLRAPHNNIPLSKSLSEGPTSNSDTPLTHTDPPASAALPASEPKKTWKETGCFYSLPQLRSRPIYPDLKTDKKKEVSSRRGDRCGKFYSQYGERRLTGGIMAAWCTHSVCYGFHCIPESEGRNDVFSAMVTRWPVAPKLVIYDFACALGPYCMLREPDFFKNTLFAIDKFHAVGHTKCSSAAFLSEYANADPNLAAINSSAAECGNSGLRRIRKSVSYMGQGRAIVYTKSRRSSKVQTNRDPSIDPGIHPSFWEDPLAVALAFSAIAITLDFQTGAHRDRHPASGRIKSSYTFRYKLTGKPPEVHDDFRMPAHQSAWKSWYTSRDTLAKWLAVIAGFQMHARQLVGSHRRLPNARSPTCPEVMMHFQETRSPNRVEVMVGFQIHIHRPIWQSLQASKRTRADPFGSLCGQP